MVYNEDKMVEHVIDYQMRLQQYPTQQHPKCHPFRHQ